MKDRVKVSQGRTLKGAQKSRAGWICIVRRLEEARMEEKRELKGKNNCAVLEREELVKTRVRSLLRSWNNQCISESGEA